MKARTPSIFSRILWLHLLALMATALSVPVAVNFLLSSSAIRLQQRTLQTHAAAVSQTLQVSPTGAWSLQLTPDLRTLYEKGYGGFALAVIDDRGGLVVSAPRDLAPMLRDVPRGAAPQHFERKRGDAMFYGASYPTRRDGRTAWIVIAQNLEHPDIIVDDVVAGFLGWMLLLILAAMAALFSIDLLIVRRALKPVVAASRAAQAIQPGATDQRLPTAALPREILPMAEAMNAALARLEAGHALQREFTADAAHELRTPLTVLRMQVDALPQRDTAAALRPGIDLMSRIVGQLLEMAELDGVSVDSDARADLQGVSMDVAVALTPLALAQDKVIRITGETAPVWVVGAAPLLFRAARNLVENAIHHTPPRTRIEIRIHRDGGLSVIDDGPGVPEGERELIFRRFWRGARKRNGGAGLGLAIARRIAETYGGAVTLTEAPRGGGGACFTLRTPLSRSDGQA